MTCICSLFWAFKPTEMTDFPTIFQKGKPYPLIYLKPEKGPLFGRSLACIGHYTCREYAPGDVCQPNNNSASRRNFFRMCISLRKPSITDCLKVVNLILTSKEQHSYIELEDWCIELVKNVYYVKDTVFSCSTHSRPGDAAPNYPNCVSNQALCFVFLHGANFRQVQKGELIVFCLIFLPVF